MTVLVVAVVTCAHWYFRETSTILDYGTIAEWVPRFDEIVPMLVRDVPLPAWMLLAVALFYAALGPWLLMRVARRWRGWSGRRSPVGTVETSFLGSLGLLLLALGFGSLSLLVGFGPASANKTFARDPFVNVVLTGVQEATASENDPYANLAVEHPATQASLAPTSQSERRNVVLIHLESTRAQSVTPYN